MEKLEFIIGQIKAIKGHRKAKNNRINFYMENFDRVEKLDWETLESFNYEREVKSWSEILKNDKNKIAIL
jgi:hypothetical protein